MASRAWKPVVTLGQGLVLLAGSFRPNGSSAIDNTLNKGIGWTVARSDVGKFTVTLADGYVGPIAIIPGVQLATALEGTVNLIGAVDVVSGKTFVLQYIEEAADELVATDIASNAANWVHFIAVVRNSELL